MAVVDTLSRTLATQKTGFDFDSLTGSRVVVARAAIPTTSSARTYTLPVSKSALDKAVAGAKSILDTLSDLSGKIDSSDGLSSGRATGSDGRAGLQADIRRLAGRIDDTVDDAEVDDINLIGTPSTTYQLRSSSLGGAISMVSQPLDSRSLGLDKLDVTTQEGTAAAKAAIDEALRTAAERYRILSEAAADLPAPASVTDSLVTSLKSLVGNGLLTGATGADPRISTGGSNTLGRGALVNFQA